MVILHTNPIAPGESKNCIHCLIKHISQNKTRILTNWYFSVYQRANLDFDVLLDIFGANLAEMFKFKKEKLLQQLLKNSRKRCIIFLKWHYVNNSWHWFAHELFFLWGYLKHQIWDTPPNQHPQTVQGLWATTARECNNLQAAMYH